MRKFNQVLVGFVGVIFLLGGFIDIGGVQAARPFDDLSSEHSSLSGEIGSQHGILQGDIADALAALQGNIATLQGTVDALGGGEGNHTLRWDKLLDSTNGDNIPTTGCNSDRFKCIFGGEAVLDLETGLVWEREPGNRKLSWSNATLECANNTTTGGRKAWRLPSFHELASLLDPATSNLQAGSPFILTVIGAYWSATAAPPELQARAWTVAFNNGVVGRGNQKTVTTIAVWCVRHGGPLSVY